MFPKVAKSSNVIIYLKVMLINLPKKSPNIWDIFGSAKIVSEIFYEKTSNLVTQGAVRPI